METFDYLVALFSIVIGLGLAEVAVSLNSLLRGAGLKHDPLIFGPPILVMLMLVSIWFDTWAWAIAFRRRAFSFTGATSVKACRWSCATSLPA